MSTPYRQPQMGRPQAAPVVEPCGLADDDDVRKPPRILVYGDPGVGKTTWPSRAPLPLYIPIEEGHAGLGVKATRRPQSWAQFLATLQGIATNRGYGRKTLVIDSVDALEPMCWAHVCAEDKVTSIELVGGGYGKGYSAAGDQWRLAMSLLDALREPSNGGMTIVLLAHAAVRDVKNPEGADYEQVSLKVNKKPALDLIAWADVVGYAKKEAFVSEDKRAKRSKAVVGGRLLCVGDSAAYVSKRRRTESGQELPDELPLEWDAFARIWGGSLLAGTEPSVSAEDIEALIAEHALDDERAEKLRGWHAAKPRTQRELAAVVAKVTEGK